MKLIALDPGIDTTGVAVFEVTPPIGAGMLERLRHLRDWHLIKTSARDPLALRLQHLAAAAAGLAHGADLVIVERPPTAGMYSRHRGREKQMAVPLAKLWMATGAIAGSAAQHATNTLLLPATLESKTRRHQLLERVFAAAKRDDLLAIRQPDILDAIWLGLVQMNGRVA